MWNPRLSMRFGLLLLGASFIPLSSWAESAAIPTPTVAGTATISATPTPKGLPQVSLPAERKPRAYFSKLTPEYFPDYLRGAAKQFLAEDYDGTLLTLEKVEAGLGNKLARARSPENIYFLRALCYQAQNNHPAALEAFDEALRYRGSSSDISFFRGLSQVELGRTEQAVASINEAIWFGKMHAIPKEEMYLSLGVIYRLANLLPKAGDAFNAAIAANAGFLPARAENATLELDRGNKQQALALLRDAVAQTPKSFDLRLALAKALLLNSDRTLNKGDLAEAKRVTSELLNPNELSKQEYVTALPVHIKALLANGEIDEADRVVNLALKHDPEAPEIKALHDQVALERKASERPSATIAATS